ncbi:hypothetical protein [Tautonia plasticadhaerens]|uniref:Uncharacterized protein n=1 Tax=Tautonia plasticadhaerens TaxID=2527974 RepID=A0A518H0C2_9BACT|nr:hypothetical protein [Tautonia plasticadhaerens]QDV34294.1 hypothetical protein ElP_21790 [Tautonia plasticadhaerens]
MTIRIGLISRHRLRFTIGTMMAIIAVIATVLAIASDAARGGWFGLASLSIVSPVALAYLVLFAVPRTLVRLLLWLIPCLRAEDEDPL